MFTLGCYNFIVAFCQINTDCYWRGIYKYVRVSSWKYDVMLSGDYIIPAMTVPI